MGGEAPVPAGDYYRRRADELLDDRLELIMGRLDRHGEKLDRLEARVNYLFGALAILSIVINLLGPIVARIVA